MEPLCKNNYVCITMQLLCMYSCVTTMYLLQHSSEPHNLNMSFTRNQHIKESFDLTTYFFAEISERKKFWKVRSV